MQPHSMPACCTCCNGTRWYILPSRPTTHFHPRIMDFIVMPHTPITFNYKIILSNHMTSRFHLNDKQHTSHSFTMHAARVEWRPHFTLPPLPFPPFIMHIHTPMYYIPYLITYSHTIIAMILLFMIISWIVVWYAHEKQSARIRDQTRISRHYHHSSSSSHAFTRIPVYLDMK